MKKLVFLLLIASSHWTFLLAQPQIIVEGTGGTRLFTDILEAVADADDGDFIYLPGAFYNTNNTEIAINKEIHIIGAGWFPDSTAATGRTVISAPIRYYTGSDNSTLEGVDLVWGGGSHHILLETGAVVSNLHFKNLRCNTIYYTSVAQNSNMVIENCIFVDLSGSEVSSPNLTVRNNLITRSITFVESGTITNNVFTYGIIPLQHIDNTVIANNYFASGDIFGFGSVSNSFNNNICAAASFDYSVAEATGFNNIANISFADAFVDFNGVYVYSSDMHIATGSAGENAGLDGTDIGIFGGVSPTKNGWVPHNPHIQFETITGTSSLDGFIDIQIRVAAQDE